MTSNAMKNFIEREISLLLIMHINRKNAAELKFFFIFMIFKNYL